jgi:hypothetical protein
MLDYAPPPDISNAIAYDKQRNPPLVEIVSNMSNPLGDLEKKIGGSVYLAQNDSVASDGGYGKNRPITDAFDLYRMSSDASEIMPFARSIPRGNWLKFDKVLNVTKYFVNDLYDQGGDGPAVRSHLRNQGKFKVGNEEYTFDYDRFIDYIYKKVKNIEKVWLHDEGFLSLLMKNGTVTIPIDPNFVKYYDSL